MGVADWFGRSERLFNQANEHWRHRQRSLIENNEAAAREECVEVIRFCQQSISANKKNGDAYVLLGNALLSASSRSTSPSDRDALHAKAVAVIHEWYCLPHRGYPITKNTAMGEKLWRIVVDEMMKDKSLAEKDAVRLMESYRSTSAAHALSPDSLDDIMRAILHSGEASEPDRHFQGLA
jgi:hypothetical protein